MLFRSDSLESLFVLEASHRFAVHSLLVTVKFKLAGVFWPDLPYGGFCSQCRTEYCRVCSIIVHYAVTTLLYCVWSHIENNFLYAYYKLWMFFAAAVLVVLSRNIYWKMNFRSLFHCCVKEICCSELRGNCHFYTENCM